jgi:hypothetical protein
MNEEFLKKYSSNWWNYFRFRSKNTFLMLTLWPTTCIHVSNKSLCKHYPKRVKIISLLKAPYVCTYVRMYVCMYVCMYLLNWSMEGKRPLNTHMRFVSVQVIFRMSANKNACMYVVGAMIRCRIPSDRIQSCRTIYCRKKLPKYPNCRLILSKVSNCPTYILSNFYISCRMFHNIISCRMF